MKKNALIEFHRLCVKRYADILDNCLFPAGGLTSLLTPSEKAWRKKIQGWADESRAVIKAAEAKTPVAVHTD